MQPLASGIVQQILPSGLIVPPLPYVAVLIGVTVAIVGVLFVLEPPVTQVQVAAFTPWMVSGGIFHVLYQIGAFPELAEPFFSAPAVYLTTFDLLGFIWIPSVFFAEIYDDTKRIARYTGTIGAGILLVLIAISYWQALGLIETTTPLIWPGVGVLAAAIVFIPLYWLLAVWQSGSVASAGIAGVVAVYAHVLDGVSTAIGVDIVGTAERSPLPRRIMEFAGTLPTAQYIGSGWLFVVVKFVVAVGIVMLFSDYIEEQPSEGNIMLAFVAALGLGPAANNLFLFLVGGPTPFSAKPQTANSLFIAPPGDPLATLVSLVSLVPLAPPMVPI